jgi:hypothetical protein
MEIGCLTTCVSDSCLCLVHNFALAMVYIHLSTKGKHFQLFCVWFESTLTLMFYFSFRFIYIYNIVSGFVLFSFKFVCVGEVLTI